MTEQLMNAAYNGMKETEALIEKEQPTGIRKLELEKALEIYKDNYLEYQNRQNKEIEQELLGELADLTVTLKTERISLEMEFEHWKNLKNFYEYNEEAIKNKRNRAEKTIENNYSRIKKDLRLARQAEDEAIEKLHQVIADQNKITI